MPASPSSSSSYRSSITPPSQISIPKKKRSTRKQKSIPSDDGKNEGEDPDWAYAPPSDAILLNDEGNDAGEFDWDSVKNNDDLELWLIRIPDSIKPKALNNFKIELSQTSKSACIGTMNRKHATFDIWSVGDDDNQPVGGEEIKSLSCLLPRKREKGKLYPAPKPFARHVVIVAQPVQPTLDPSTTTETAHKNPPRFSYPTEVLKHSYVPYGSLLHSSTADEEVSTMDVDDSVGELPSKASPKKKRSKTATAEDIVEATSIKGKKRKGEVVDTLETPAKKSKKTKVAY